MISGSPSSRFSTTPLRMKPRDSQTACIAVFDWFVDVKSLAVGERASTVRIRGGDAIPSVVGMHDDEDDEALREERAAGDGEADELAAIRASDQALAAGDPLAQRFGPVAHADERAVERTDRIVVADGGWLDEHQRRIARAAPMRAGD